MRTIVISGGSSGIGKACVEKFISDGHQVYNLDIIDDQDQELIKQRNYSYIKTNVKEQANITQAITQIVAKMDTIDVVVASAGKHLFANIEETSNEQLLDITYTNLLGVFWLIQAAIPIMKNKRKGKIITIGSDQCSIAKKNSTIYGMTKTAILSLTKSIALDYAQYNIQANCIGAGTIDTPLYRNAIEQYAKIAAMPLRVLEAAEANAQPVGRIGMAAEVAELVYFLASNKSDFITGALFPIDGGYIAQ